MNLPPFANYPILKAGVYTLRQISPSDIKHILELSYWDGKPASTLKQAVVIQNKVDEDYLQGNSIHWGIANESDDIIGVCGYYRGFADNKGEIGFVMKKAYRGKGIMRQALLSIIQFGIEVIALDYIYAITGADNKSAIGLFEKLNAKKLDNFIDGEIEYQLYKK